MMKKTLVAVAALAATAAFAQVTLTGRANMDLSTMGTSGSTVAGTDFATRTRVADAGSRITFAANEDLGGGMHAGAYCETGINIDTATANGQANTANLNTSEWCSREGRLVLGNKTVELRLGRQNVWWTQGEINPTGSSFIGTDISSNMFNGGVGVQGVRLENMIMLHGNSDLGAFAGSQIYTGYTTPNEATGAVGTTNVQPKGTYSGFKALYTAGKFVAQMDYQTATDANVSTNLNTNFDRVAAKYGLGYKYATGSIASVQYWNKERTDKTNPLAAFSASSSSGAGKGKDAGYVIAVNHTISPTVMLLANYAKMDNITDTVSGEIADSGATAYTLGGLYRLSKRTHVYAAVHNVRNDKHINYGMSGGSYQSFTPANGSTLSVTSLGLQHNF
jgi:predicted porin